MPQDHKHTAVPYTGPITHDIILWAERHSKGINSLRPDGMKVGGADLAFLGSYAEYADPAFVPSADLVLAATSQGEYLAAKHEENKAKKHGG